MQSDWPGNVRELQNYIERIMAMTPGRVLRPNPLPRDLEGRSGRPRLGRGQRLTDLLGELEHRLVREALERCSGNQSRPRASWASPSSPCAIGCESTRPRKLAEIGELAENGDKDSAHCAAW